MDTYLGQTLQGRYQVRGFLGRGGMADVYLAFDTERSVDVAIKVMREDLAEEPQFVRRFAREAQALAALDHPNIVRFYGFEQQGHIAFIVLDYVAGGNLRRRMVDAGGPLPLEEASAILRQVGAALSYAHRRGILHRDVKPGNVMLGSGGRALLSDFGIARVAEATTLTAASGTAGTPAYMSPEQIRGLELTPQSDVYSLGVVLYEMVTGRRPFEGEKGSGATAAERVRDEHLHLAAPDPAQVNPALPAAAGAVLLKALAKTPADRWPDAMSFVRAWDGALSPAAKTEARPEPATVVAPRPASRPVPRPAVEQAACPVLPVARPANDEPPVASRRRPRLPLLLGLVGVAFVALVVAAAVMVMNQGQATAPEPTRPMPTPTQRPTAPPTAVALVLQPSATPRPAVTPTPEPAAVLPRVAVATNPEFPPFEFRDGEGKLAGFDIQLMLAVGKEAGFAPEFVQTPFDGILDRLAQGEYDAVISAVTITEARGQKVAFSAPYLETGLAAVVRTDSPSSKPEDLNGRPIGVQVGTAGEAEAVGRYGDANVRRFDDPAGALRALSAGEVDAVVTDMPVAQGYIGTHPQANLRLLPDLLTREQYGIAVNRGNPDLVAAINDGLARVHANGTYDALYRKWIMGGG